MAALVHSSALIAGASRQSIPLEVSLEITHHCNFRCQHCYIPDFLTPDLLSTERIFSLLEELAEMGTLYLTLTGGEMFLRKDWFEIARRARDLGFCLRLFSNGALITEEVADQIAELHCGIEISFFSTDEGVFDELTQRPGSYRKTKRGVLLLRDRGVEVLLKVPLTRINFAGHQEIALWAKEIEVDCRVDYKIVAKKNGDPSTLDMRLTEEELSAYYQGPHSGCSLPSEYSDNPDQEGPLCAAGHRFANITAAGEVMACNILPGVAGTLHDATFREIWEGSDWLTYLRGLRRKDLTTCSTCDKMAYCGRCHSQALVEDGSLTGPSSWSCSHAETLERLDEAASGELGDQENEQAAGG